jgi:hypothetical protein
MNHLRLAVAAILSAVAVPLQVAAWNAPTHMVTGDQCKSRHALLRVCSVSDADTPQIQIQWKRYF